MSTILGRLASTKCVTEGKSCVYERMLRIAGLVKAQSVATRTSGPGDGDVIHLDISAPRLSDERVAEFLKSDPFLNLKKP